LHYIFPPHTCIFFYQPMDGYYYYCSLCECPCSGPESYEQHLRGKKHKRNAKRKRAYGHVQPTPRVLHAAPKRAPVPEENIPSLPQQRDDEEGEGEIIDQLKCENARLRAKLMKSRARCEKYRARCKRFSAQGKRLSMAYDLLVSNKATEPWD